MEICEADIDIKTHLMVFPATNEVIFAPGDEDINTGATAYKGSWHTYCLETPNISDSDLKIAWEKAYENWEKFDSKKVDLYEMLEKFFIEYENPDWFVYACEYGGFACGPVNHTVYYVVSEGTIIDCIDEEDSDDEEEDYEDEEYEGEDEEDYEEQDGAEGEKK